MLLATIYLRLAPRLTLSAGVLQLAQRQRSTSTMPYASAIGSCIKCSEQWDSWPLMQVSDISACATSALRRASTV